MRDESPDSREENGSTPLDEDEASDLIPSHLSTRAELNQWEAKNIERAHDWIAARSPRVLDVAFLRELHGRMFGETWAWAGEFRRAEKNLSPYHWTEVPRLLADLVANMRVQHERSERTPEALDELAIRFHHELVRIHPWPNGNGRHSRLATDLLLRGWGRPPFTWGNAGHQEHRGETRVRYIAALKRADAGDFDDLLRFARS